MEGVAKLFPPTCEKDFKNYEKEITIQNMGYSDSDSTGSLCLSKDND